VARWKKNVSNNFVKTQKSDILEQKIRAEIYKNFVLKLSKLVNFVKFCKTCKLSWFHQLKNKPLKKSNWSQ